MMKILSLIFSVWLIGSAQAGQAINAGPIWSNDHAQRVCPQVCERNRMDWSGQWWTTVQGRMSVCQCEDRYRNPRRDDRPRYNRGGVERFELTFNRNRVFRGQQTIFLKRRLREEYGVNLNRFRIKAVVLVAKSRHGGGKAYLTVGDASSFEEIIDGRPHEFLRRGGYSRVRLRNPKRNSRGPWQLHLRGQIKIKKVIVKLERKHFR